MSGKFTPAIDLNPKTFNLFQTTDFRKFLIENNVAAIIVSFTIGYYIKELIDSLYDNILFCEKNTKKILNQEICILGISIKPGRFLISLIKFMISCLLAFYIVRLLNDIID